MRIGNLASPLLVAVPLALLLFTGCSSNAGSNGRSDLSLTCDEVLASVVHLERTGDSAGTIDAELDWLSGNCSAEYDVFTDYMSAKVAAEQSGPEPCDFMSQYVGQESIALLSADNLCTSDTTESQAEAPGRETQSGGGIAWNDAVNYAGTTQRVCGPLAGDGTSNDDVFLNLGRDYPDPQRFQIVLWDIGGVEPIPYGTTVCTSGQVTLYEGVAQIELESVSQVELYE